MASSSCSRYAAAASRAPPVKYKVFRHHESELKADIIPPCLCSGNAMMHPEKGSGSSEPRNPEGTLWFWPRSITQEPVNASPARQYMLRVSGHFPPHFGCWGLHRRGLHGCRPGRGGCSGDGGVDTNIPAKASPLGRAGFHWSPPGALWSDPSARFLSSLKTLLPFLIFKIKRSHFYSARIAYINANTN